MPISTRLVYVTLHQAPIKPVKTLKITVRLTPQWVHSAGMFNFFDTRQVSQKLQVDQATVRKWLRQGKLTGVKLPGKAGWRVREDVLEAWLTAQEVHRG